jgi:hypothetical protein
LSRKRKQAYNHINEVARTAHGKYSNMLFNLIKREQGWAILGIQKIEDIQPSTHKQIKGSSYNVAIQFDYMNLDRNTYVERVNKYISSVLGFKTYLLENEHTLVVEVPES